jgi:hypothetical protein
MARLFFNQSVKFDGFEAIEVLSLTAASKPVNSRLAW